MTVTATRGLWSIVLAAVLIAAPIRDSKAFVITAAAAIIYLYKHRHEVFELQGKAFEHHYEVTGKGFYSGAKY